MKPLKILREELSDLEKHGIVRRRSGIFKSGFGDAVELTADGCTILRCGHSRSPCGTRCSRCSPVSCLSGTRFLKPRWTGAMLGLAGLGKFRTRIRLFQNISEKEGPSANLERFVAGMQPSCFAQINRHLPRRHVLTERSVYFRYPSRGTPTG